MAYAWAKEKEYCKRRSAQLVAEMETAIAEGDSDRFLATYSLSLRYTSKEQRLPLYKKFLERNVNS